MWGNRSLPPSPTAAGTCLPAGREGTAVRGPEALSSSPSLGAEGRPEWGERETVRVVNPLSRPLSLCEGREEKLLCDTTSDNCGS